MGNNIILISICAGFLIIGTPFILSSKDFVEDLVGKEAKKSSQLRKIISILCTTIILIIASCYIIGEIPMLVNRLYKTKTGVVKEIRKVWDDYEEHRYNSELKKYDVLIEDIETGKKLYNDILRSDKLKEGDIVEVRVFSYSEALVTKRNGQETAYYKKQYERSWIGDPNGERIILTLIVLVNIFIQLLKYYMKRTDKSKTKYGVLFWKIWNYGCAVFSLMMLISIWYPIYNRLTAYVLGGVLSLVFVVYHMAGVAYCLEHAGFVWKETECAEEKEKPKVEKRSVEMKKEESTKMHSVISGIELKPMSPEIAKKYCIYKYKERKTEMLDYIFTWQGGSVFAIVMVNWIGESEKIGFAVTVIGVILFILAPIWEVRSYNKNYSQLKEASKSSCEYAVVTVDYLSEEKYVCTDGKVKRWIMSYESDLKLKAGDKAVVVYLSATDQMFIERSDILKRMAVRK